MTTTSFWGQTKASKCMLHLHTQAPPDRGRSRGRQQSQLVGVQHVCTEKGYRCKNARAVTTPTAPQTADFLYFFFVF